MPRSRFSIQLTVRDNYTGESWNRAVDCDEALTISNRIVEDIKFGADLGVMSFDGVVEVLKTKEIRREVLLHAAQRLATGLADTLEDAEGWHHSSRVEPAKRVLKLA